MTRYENGLATLLRTEEDETILRVLAQDVSPERHRHTMELLVKSLRVAYHSAHLPEPAWLGDLRRRMDLEPAR